MAEYAQAPALSPRPPSSARRRDETEPPTSKLLQHRGSCSFRDLLVGHKCGCTTFWENEGHSHADNNASFESTPWCVCGHHACYHATVQPQAAGGNQATASSLPGKIVKHNGHWYMRLTPESSHLWSQTSERKGEATHTTGHAKVSATGRKGAASASTLPPEPSDPNQKASSQGILGPDYLELLSSQPSIPSACLLGSDELHNFGIQSKHAIDGALSDVFYKPDPLMREPSGLGLSLQQDLRDSKAWNKNVHHAQSRAGDQIDVRRSWSQSIAPSTRPSSAAGTGAGASPSRVFLHHAQGVEGALPQLDVPQSLPPQVDAEDIVQSATEVATPSNANTPDLRASENNLSEVKSLLEFIARASANSGNFSGSVGKVTAASPHLLLPGPSSNQNEAFQGANRSLPLALSKFLASINSAQGFLTSYPQVAASLSSLAARVDGLENASFQHIPPEELDNRLESLDGRLLEVESWKEDHDRNRSCNQSKSFDRPHPLGLGENKLREGGSFASVHSTGSASALVGAMLDKHEIEGIKGRIDDLEAAAMPSATAPWVVEVVLLPWGRGLRGIWYSLDDATSSNYRGSPVESEEWTQAMSVKSVRSSSRASVANIDHRSGGWNSQAIHAWASSADDWLSPKACGAKNAVYQRLKSRGFVRNVTIRSPNAGDIQADLKAAFSDIHDIFDVDQSLSSKPSPNNEDIFTVHPALKSSFIPLRKIVNNRKLHFLRPAELATSALWTAQFLASGVIMRVSGGQKRLFMTHRDAYIQGDDALSAPWTWQRLRELPRMHVAQGSQSSGNSGHVGEADAKEACWAYYPKFDPPISVTSSFASESSMQSVVPEPQSALTSIKHSPPPAEAEKHVAAPPISPLSEFAKGRPSSLRRVRTVSAPLTDVNSADLLSSTQQPSNLMSSGKRRNASFEASLPSSAFASLPTVPISSLPKRRRLTRSPGTEGSLQIRAWGLTPRRSKEPLSPFFDERSGVGSEGLHTSSSTAVTSGHAAGGITQLPAIRKRGPTPSAYATPHSGSGVGLGPRVAFGFGGTDGGDTEVDSEHGGEERDADDRGDGESWHGLNGDDDNSVDDAGPGKDDMSIDGEAEEDGDGESSGFGDEDDEELCESG